MANKNYITYYGEYSLVNWIKMILNQEISLPNYQRFFVWDEKMAVSLLKNLQKGLFVPPIILASYSGDKTNKSTVYVLDGQQRLSSILLFYLGYWPIVSNETEEEDFINDESTNDAGVIINEDSSEKTSAQDWSFKEIQDIYQELGSIDALKESLGKNKRYIKIDESLKKITDYQEINNKEGFKNSFVGFSFIKGINTNNNDEKKLFSEIFRTINTSSIPLTAVESRAALYWLRPDCKDFFMPDFVSKIKVNNFKFDWVRCLSYASEANKLYSKSKSDYCKVAVGYGNRIKPYEKYIELFVRSIVDDIDTAESLFTPYESDYSHRVQKVAKFYDEFLKKLKFSSLIDVDCYFFGLVFWIIFQNKELNLPNEETIRTFHYRMQKIIAPKKEELAKMKASNKVTQIRNRLKESINVYKGFI